MRQFIKIERVSPITIKATRWYEEWVIVRILTDQGIEGIGEGFTWRGQASTIRSHIETIAQQITGTNPMAIEAFLKRFLFSQSNDRDWCAAVSANEIGTAVL